MLAGHTDVVRCVVFSPDVDIAASGSIDRTVRLWNITTGKEIQRLQINHPVFSIAFSPDGCQLLVGAQTAPDPQSTSLWDVKKGLCVRSFGGHKFGASGAVAFSADGGLIASGGQTPSICIWDARTTQEVQRVAGHRAEVKSVAFTPDKSRILAASSDTVALWNVQTGELSLPLAPKYSPFCAISPDGRRALLGNRVGLWNLDTGEEIRRLQGDKDLGVITAAFFSDGRFGVTCSPDMSIRVWDLSRGTELECFRGHSGQVTSVAVSADGRFAISGSYDNTVRLWPVGDLLRASERSPS